MNYIKCPSCGCVLVRKNGIYDEFIGCSNYPRCNYSQNISDFDADELKKIHRPLKIHKGECNRCGQIRTLNEMGLCDSCAEWYEKQ